MDESIDIVKGLAEGLRSSADFANQDEKRRALFNQRAEALESVLNELERLQELTRPIPKNVSNNLSDLPPALLKELTVVKSDDLEEKLYNLIKANGDVADIDTLLITLYRRFDIQQTRRYLQNKLWRMGQKELIWSVPNKKGHYTTTPPEEANEAKKESGDEPDESPFDLDDEIPF